MKNHSNFMLFILLLFGLQFQSTAQCNLSAQIYSDSITCPVQGLYASAWGGTAPYTYQWTNGATSSYIGNLSPGFYAVTVTDTTGCFAVDTFTIQNVSPITATHQTTHTTCGQNNGIISTIVSGGSGNYSYDWYDSNWNYLGANSTLFLAAAGSYHVYINDVVSGCATQINNIVVSGSTALNAILYPDSLNCPANYVAVGLQAGTTAPYTYAWSNGATTSSISGLTVTNTYTVTVTDANGCTDIESFYVDSCNQSCTINGFIWGDTSQCPVSTIGAYGYGGTSPYSYLWSNGSTLSTQDSLAAGTYTVTITDANGCTFTDSYTIISMAPVVTTYVVNDASCNQNDGSIDLSVSGGSGSFDYDWYDAQWNYLGNSQDLNNLGQGSYSVYINDLQYGCFSQITNIQVSSNSGSINVSSTDASCGQANGSATVNITGFNNPMIYWSNGATSPSISGLSQGWYAVTVTDSFCTEVDSFYIGNQGNMWVYLWNQGCGPDSLEAYVSGGTAPYTYEWSNGQVTNSNNFFDYAWGALGSNSVTVTDANGCSETASITVGPPMTVNYAIQDASCTGNDGAINLTVNGGDGMYIFSWSNNQWTEDVSGLTPGTYSVHVYDSSGCYIFLDSLVVGGSGNAVVNAYVIPSNCTDSAGAVVQTVTGLNNPSYLWSNGATTANLNNVSSGWYGCTISDNSGCTLTRNYFVDQDSSCLIDIAGYVYNVSLSNTCTPAAATPVAYTMVVLQPLGLTTFTNANGYYDFSVSTPGNYTVEFVNASGFYTQLCPTGTIAVNNTSSGNYYGGNDFFVVSPNAQDLSVDLSHYTTATPGFGLWTTVQFCNDGQVAMSGTIDYVYDAQVTFDQIWNITGPGQGTFTGHNAANNLLTFSFTNLQPGQCGNIYVDLNVPATVPLGSIVGNAVTIYPINGDATPGNNTDVDTLTVVGSWDPNEKLAGPLRSGDERGAGVIYSGDNTLEYTIHFQNLGTAPAYRVEVRDTLESDLLPETVRNIQASHDVQVEIQEGNILVFTFENINLPHASFDFHGSNGFVKFTIDRQAGLDLGTRIDNNAAIYFDFNAPVITNMTEITISDPTAVAHTVAGNLEATVYPNPFQELLNIDFELATDTEVSIILYDALGQRLRSYKVGEQMSAGQHHAQISTADLVPAMYLLSIETKEGKLLQKIVKQ